MYTGAPVWFQRDEEDFLGSIHVGWNRASQRGETLGGDQGIACSPQGMYGEEGKEGGAGGGIWTWIWDLKAHRTPVGGGGGA